VKSKIPFKCNFCGKLFEVNLTSNILEVRCSRCGDLDIEPLDFSNVFKPRFIKRAHRVSV